jgi:hypothetical protein
MFIGILAFQVKLSDEFSRVSDSGIDFGALALARSNIGICPLAIPYAIHPYPGPRCENI